jgi:predicted transcriptional regulator
MRKALDHISVTLDRDRSYVVNQALAAYVSMYQWQVDHIRKGLGEAEAGKFVPKAKVDKVIRRLRGK